MLSLSIGNMQSIFLRLRPTLSSSHFCAAACQEHAKARQEHSRPWVLFLALSSGRDKFIQPSSTSSRMGGPARALSFRCLAHNTVLHALGAFLADVLLCVIQTW